MRTTRAHRILALLATVVLGAAPAAAITNGESDGGRHPAVGIIAYGMPQPSPPLGSSVNPLCSGTLIAPDVFLTAGHCVAAIEDYIASGFPQQVWVSFDEVYGPDIFDPDTSSFVPVREFHKHPAYHEGEGFPGYAQNDIGVLLLDLPNKPLQVQMPVPAQLPAPGLLDDLRARNGLHRQTFMVVGYGLKRTFPPPGPPRMSFNFTRSVAGSDYRALAPDYLHCSQNPNTGDGGTCYGDSGGPYFLGDTTTVAAVTSSGDSQCRAFGSAFRTDTENARSFLQNFVTLP